MLAGRWGHQLAGLDRHIVVYKVRRLGAQIQTADTKVSDSTGMHADSGR
jgi:hypothetical protein